MHGNEPGPEVLSSALMHVPDDYNHELQEYDEWNPPHHNQPKIPPKYEPIANPTSTRLYPNGFPQLNAETLLRGSDQWVTEEEEEARNTSRMKKVASNAMKKAVLVRVGLVACWFGCSVAISSYNRWMFGGAELDFHYPIFTTCFHMVVQFVLCCTAMWLMVDWRPNVELDQPLMTSKFYFVRIAPAGLATGMDIGLGNWSLRFVTLIFYTICKSSTIMWVMAFAVVLGLERWSWKIGGIVTTMVLGVSLTVWGEMHFKVFGFILLMIASACSGLRWSLTQMLLRGHPATSNPLSSLFFLTPIQFVALFVLGCIIEGLGNFVNGVFTMVDQQGVLWTFTIFLIPGLLAFAMTVAEFALIQRSSVITLSVCGIFKEIVSIFIGQSVFHEALTGTNIAGIIVTISAFGMYQWLKIQSLQRDTLRDAQAEVSGEHDPMLSTADRRGSHHSNGENAASLMRRSLSASTHEARTHTRARSGTSPTTKVNQD